jgi:hypothetical protein
MAGKAIPTNAVAVTPSDTDYITPGTLWVGGYGNLNVLLADMPASDDPDDGIVFTNVQGNFPRMVKKVFATSTTATAIILDK